MKKNGCSLQQGLGEAIEEFANPKFGETLIPYVDEEGRGEQAIYYRGNFQPEEGSCELSHALRAFEKGDEDTFIKLLKEYSRLGINLIPILDGENGVTMITQLRVVYRAIFLNKIKLV